MPVKWFGSGIEGKLKKAKSAYKYSVGESLVNQIVNYTPVMTGLLQNSMHYVLDDGKKSEFKNENGGAIPNSSNVLRRPKYGFIRVGSAVIYASSVNKRGKSAGYFNRGVDQWRRNRTAESIGNKIFERFF